MLAALAFTLGARPSRAEEAVPTVGRVQLLASLLWGRDFDKGDERPLGLGFGARGGYTFSNEIYLGARFEHFLGATNAETGGTHSWRIGQLQLEGGRDISLGRAFVVRPLLAAGLAYRAGKCRGLYCDSASSTEFGFAVAPGVDLAWQRGTLLLASGAAFNVFILDRAAIAALELGVHGGIAF